MYIDSHAHLDAPEFTPDRDDVIMRARDGGIGVILNIGAGYVSENSIEIALDLADRYEFVYLAFGIQPHDAKLYDQNWETRLLDLATHPKVLAWGEIGLDYHYAHSPLEVQQEVFERQVQLARAHHLPIVVHSREAEPDTVAILRRSWEGSEVPGIMHCFTGSLELAEACLEMNFFISFSGIVTFRNAQPLRDVACRIPSDRLLIESDCPLLSPVPFRGKRNEPLFVRYVARQLAELRGVEEDEIGQLTTANFFRIFSKCGSERTVRFCSS